MSITAPTNFIMFWKWIMAFVGHFSVQCILEKHIGDLHLIKRFILIFSPCPTLKWKSVSGIMEGLIQDIEKLHDADYKMAATKYISTVKKHLLAYKAEFNSCTGEQDRIFPILNDLMDQGNGALPPELQVQFPRDKHCETIFATFLACCDIATLEEKNNPKFKELCEVLDSLTVL